jgi:hypothetical protein
MEMADVIDRTLDHNQRVKIVDACVRKGAIRRWIITAAMAAWALALSPLSENAYAVSEQTPWENQTQAQLSAVWWQWLYSVPASKSPAIDTSGANAYNGQPYSSLLFLAGTFTVIPQNGNVLGQVTRSIAVKEGTALFFPLLNNEYDNVGCRPNLGMAPGLCLNGQTPPPEVLGVPQLQAAGAAALNPASGLFATLASCSDALCTTTTQASNVTYARLQSPPFKYTLPSAPDNLQALFGYNVSGTVAPAVANGYYSLVPGNLAPGYYKLEFGGRAPINNVPNYFIEDITYLITVTP